MLFYWVDHYFEKVLNLSTCDQSELRRDTSSSYGRGNAAWRLALDKIEHARGTPVAGKLFRCWESSAGAVLLFVGVYAREPRGLYVVFDGFAAVGMAEGPCGRRPFTWADAGEERRPDPQYRRQRRGLAAPYLTPLIGQHYGRGPAVTLGGLICLSGALAWLWIDRRKGPRLA